MSMSGVARSREIIQRDYPDDCYQAMPANLHPVIRRVYAARNVAAGELDQSLARLIPVSALRGAAGVAERLVEAYERQERVLILGDFDVDGATSTALCISCMRAMGFDDVVYLIPNRVKFGYGLSPEIAEQAAKLDPAIILTVDNGISSVAGARRSAELGIEVLITDHHLPGRELPPALRMVNPNLPDETFPSKNLAGVGVAFYVMAALGRALAERGSLTIERSRAIVADALDLVALGTVADMVKLDYNNRILVAEGMARMRSGRVRPGIQALFEVAGRSIVDARSADLGFAIAPRLNAAGRLADMSLGVDCLLETDRARAAAMATRLDTVNIERRTLQAQMEASAQRHVREARERVAGQAAPAFCLFADDWHEGVVGLVASRVKDVVRRPVIAFANAGAQGQLKGSARSIDGIHIRDVLDAVAALHPELIGKFGGHAMAAGLSLALRDLAFFRQAFADEVGKYTSALQAPDVILTDGGLSAQETGIELAEAIGRAGPWGQGFPEPVFVNEFEIEEQRVLKGQHLKLRVRQSGQQSAIDAIAFNQPELPDSGSGHQVRLVYRLDVNVFRNQRNPQLVVEYMQSV
jgi:single-stranded-DNA-specific exonuclease